MRNYSAVRGTFWQAWPAYYEVCGRVLPASGIANLAAWNV